MFAFVNTFRTRAAVRAADMIDLAIEFATLGEYGLEYPDPVPSTGCRQVAFNPVGTQPGGPPLPHPAERARPQRHRHRRRPGSTRTDLPGWSERLDHRIPGPRPVRRHHPEAHTAPSRGRQRNRPTAALPEALRPPGINPEMA